MLLRRILSHVRTENWFAVFLDFVVVVVGLFIGLQIDTWWQARSESRLEGAYLIEIQEDFELNQSTLNDTVAELEEVARNMIVLYEAAALETPKMSVPELNQTLRSIGSMPAFAPVSRAYANLTGSGDLNLIQSRQLKNALADYYAWAEVIMLVQGTHEMELVQIYEPYMIANLEYAAVHRSYVGDFSLPPLAEESSILDVMGTREFRNVLIQKWVITTDLLSQHRAMLKRTENVLKMLEQIDRL